MQDQTLPHPWPECVAVSDAAVVVHGRHGERLSFPFDTLLNVQDVLGLGEYLADQEWVTLPLLAAYYREALTLVEAA